MRAQEKDWKAVAWATSQHSSECGNWLKGRGGDFFPFPTSHSSYINALSLLLSTPAETSSVVCPCDARINIRNDPWHCMDCTFSHSARTRCHSRIVDLLSCALERMGHVTRSPKVSRGDTSLFADLRFTQKDKNTHFLIDVATVNPSAPKYNNTQTCGTAEVAATKKEAMKITHYRKAEIGPTDRVTPFIVECTGKLGRAGREFLKEIGMEMRDVRKLMGEIASTVAFANGECIALTNMYGSGGNRATPQPTKERRVLVA